MQELITLLIVGGCVLVAGGLIWRRFFSKKRKRGCDCSGCPGCGPGGDKNCPPGKRP